MIWSAVFASRTGVRMEMPSSGPGQHRKGRAWKYSLLLLSIFALGYAIWLAYKPISVMLSYEETQGRILSLGQEKVEQASSEGEGGGLETAYKPIVAYEFMVGDTRYTGRRYDFADRGGTLEWAREVIRNYSVGSSVTVYFNPVHPERAVLKKHIPHSMVQEMSLDAVACVVMLIVSMVQIRRRRSLLP
jgi:Protein of unknown function (DUF3592)